MLKREETEDGTAESWRGKDSSAYTRIAETTSGRANFQQGFAVTCKDFWYKGKTEAERGFWSGA